MHWRKRGNKLYLYQNVREGNRVRTIYLGSGPQAEAQYAAYLARKAQQAERDSEIARTIQMVDALNRQAGTLAKASLLAAGYHLHGAEWRKRNDQTGR